MKHVLALLLITSVISGCSSMSRVIKKKKEEAVVYEHIQKNLYSILDFYKSIGSFYEFKEDEEYSWIVHTDVPYNRYSTVQKEIHQPSLDIDLGAVHQIAKVSGLLPDFIQQDRELTKRYIISIHNILSKTGTVQITLDLKVDYMQDSSNWDSINPFTYDEIYNLTVKNAFRIIKENDFTGEKHGIFTPYRYKGINGGDDYYVEFRGKSDMSYKHAVISAELEKNALIAIRARSKTDLVASDAVVELPLDKPMKN